MRLLPIGVFAAFLAACPGTPPSAPAPSGSALDAGAAPAPAARADGRLPALATPTHYALELEIDPDQPRFSGTARIDVDIPQKTSFIVLHGRDLEIAKASLTIAGRTIAAKASLRLAQGGDEPEELVLAFDSAVPAGSGTITIAYSAPFGTSLAGLYRVKEGDRWYAFTQFEPADARGMIPCFDEPAFKVPFDVAITVPSALTAVANAPEAAREAVGRKTRIRFARTQPLPTYLLAVAVGDLEIKEATRTTKPPIRLVATKGKLALASLALEATSGLVDALGEWFGIPYPYEKLDIVAVPDFRSGAMENAGLITFREERLLLDGTRASVAARRAQALVIAHELAHQWFGDLVTASWWNDLWLNEGMATWMESRILDKWHPTYGARLDAVASAHGVMDTDGLVSARAVRQPVVTVGDAEAAFDGITYEKGAAILGTIERWIGEEAFQRGVREYLRENAWKSVQADKLLATLDRVSGKDVTAMASAYLDKPGVPDVGAQIVCEPSARWHVELSSSAWRPLGSKMNENDARTWTIPACIRAHGEKKDACTELMAGAPSMIAGRGACPTFIHPNPSASYYRFTLNERDFVRLAEGRKELEPAARVSLLSNAWAAVRSGALEPKALLKILPAFDDDDTRQVIELVVEILARMDASVVDGDARPAFQKFALARLAKRKKALGWTGPAKTDGDDALVRSSVLGAIADTAGDDATFREADALALKWLADASSVSSDIAPIALDLGSRRAGKSRLDALLAAAKSAKTREERIAALRATMGFEDEALLRQALDISLGDDVRAGEMRHVLGAVFGRRAARPIAEAWVREHWDALRKKMTGRLGVALVRAAGVGCRTADAEERSAFYTPRFASVDGSSRELAEALESVALCAALHERGAQSLGKALLQKR